jgi:Tol biopolymer transport system component
MAAEHSKCARGALFIPLRRLVCLTVAGLALALLVLAAAGCGGASSHQVDLIGVSTRDGDYAIFGMTATGEDQHRLTDERGDGSTFADLQFQTDPAWSPDGMKIAFASAREGSFDIYVMNADGSGTKRLTSDPENEQQPAWSPDGRSIAYARGGKSDRLYVMNADGSSQHRVTHDTAAESDPAWSPDGSTIAYSRVSPGTENKEIWLVTAAGTNRRQLTKTGWAAYSPAWSPDGARIAYSANVGGAKFAIFTVTPKGTGTRRVVAGAEDVFEPAFSPDGKQLAYYVDGAIGVRDGAGAETLITDPDDNTSSPAWNPKPVPTS